MYISVRKWFGATLRILETMSKNVSKMAFLQAKATVKPIPAVIANLNWRRNSDLKDLFFFKIFIIFNETNDGFYSLLFEGGRHGAFGALFYCGWVSWNWGQN